MDHIAFITGAPVKSGRGSVPDGGINGNGDLGIVTGVSEKGFRLYLSKCDLRAGAEGTGEGGAKPLGWIDFTVPDIGNRRWETEQDADRGELRVALISEADTFRLTARVCRTENTVMTECGFPGVQPVLCVFDGEGENLAYEKNGCKMISRRFRGEKYRYETSAYAALKPVGKGKWVTAVSTNHDVPAPEEDVLRRADMTEERFEELKAAHDKAWKSFWAKSAFTLSDRELENRWYASLYLLACSAGNKNYAPGLYGNFITVEDPAWHSDYHLNYNYQAPFYAACSSNHTELTDCYLAPLEQFMKRGAEFAARFGCRGILYPVGIDSNGICSELDPDNRFWFERLFLGQKSNAIHPADIPVFRWNATRDTDYAREHAYPYVKACLAFFEDYAVFENGRYIIRADAAHEIPIYRKDYDPKKYKRRLNDTNNALTLGLLRLCLTAALDMSRALDTDPDKREKWEDMLKKLSDFPTFIRKHRRVFRYTEEGQSWNDGNDVGLQHIYPCGCVGLLSDEKLLKIARETFKQKKDCRLDGNAVPSYYPMAARLGVPPETITENLKMLIKSEYAQENTLFDFGCGCLESVSVFASTLNEMALQSHQGVILLFPVWDKSIDAEFTDLRADGAFLVSSSIKNGQIGETVITSEKGGVLKVRSPFERCRVTTKTDSFVTEEKMITRMTEKGEKWQISNEAAGLSKEKKKEKK